LLWLIPWLKTYPVGTAVSATPAQRKRGQPLTWLDSNLVVISLAHICYGYYWYLLVTWLPDYLVVSRHMPLQMAGAYAAIPYTIYAIAEPVGGWMADQLVRRGWGEMRSRKVIITLAYSSSLMFLLVGHVQNDRTAIVLIGGGALVGLSSGNILAMAQRLAPPRRGGLVVGSVKCLRKYLRHRGPHHHRIDHRPDGLLRSGLRRIGLCTNCGSTYVLVSTQGSKDAGSG